MKTKSNNYKEVIKYCNDIKTGKILSGTYCKKSIERFLNDIKSSDTEGFPFILDIEQADRVIDFAESLIIPDMPTEDKHLKLLPWMKFVYYNLWGWVYKNEPDRRRFRQAYVEVARKNSKTTSLLFPMILYDFTTSEKAESYLVSKDGDQSSKSFKELCDIINEDEDFHSLCNETVSTVTSSGSRIAFFSSDSGGIDSYKNSLSVIDEFHAYDTDKIITAFRYGGRARKNNLVLIITSAGLDISKPCYAENEKARKILNGVMDAPDYFTIIYSYDDNDDWKNPNLFIKANPSLGTILRKEVLVSDLNDALITPSHQADFISKTCGIWTQGTSTWIPIQKVQQNKDIKVDEQDLLHEKCTAALDLSSVGDWTAFTLCFQYDSKYYLKHHFWLPEETLNERYKNENINIKKWIDEGYITVIPGSTIDYTYIFEYIKECANNYEITELAYDPWHSNDIIRRIEDELPNITEVPIEQSLKSMSPLTQTFEKNMLDGSIIEQCPILTWMFGNVVIKVDPNGNYKPLKASKSNTQRIDGVITSIMSFNRFIANADDNNSNHISFDSLLNSF